MVRGEAALQRLAQLAILVQELDEVEDALGRRRAHVVLEQARLHQRLFARDAEHVDEQRPHHGEAVVDLSRDALAFGGQHEETRIVVGDEPARLERLEARRTASTVRSPVRARRP